MTVQARPAQRPVTLKSKPQPASSPKRPPLNPGARLSRTKFEQRFNAHPEIKKAEPIEGVVYIPSPTHFERRGEPRDQIITWLGLYSHDSQRSFDGLLRPPECRPENRTRAGRIGNSPRIFALE